LNFTENNTSILFPWEYLLNAGNVPSPHRRCLYARALLLSACSHLAPELIAACASMAMMMPKSRYVSAGHLLVASSPILLPGPLPGEPKWLHTGQGAAKITLPQAAFLG
jgi:hypothetical protein